MARDLANLIRVPGPFKGLNVSTDPRQLDAAWATSCANVHVAHGAIERRPGKTLMEAAGDPALPLGGGEPVRAVYYHTEYEAVGGGGSGFGFAFAVAGTTLYVRSMGATNMWLLLSDQIDGDMTPTFVRLSKTYAMILDGVNPPTMWAWGGSPESMGIPTPTVHIMLASYSSDPTSRLVIPAKTQVRLTYYHTLFLPADPASGPPIPQESNALQMEGPVAGENLHVYLDNASEDPIAKKVEIAFGAALAAGPPGATLRIYRSWAERSFPLTEVDLATPYSEVLPAYLALETTTGMTFPDQLGMHDLDNSMVAPTRNALPPPALFAVEYFGRMIYAGNKSPTADMGWDKIWYSEEMEFAHVAENNWEQIGADGAAITGLAVYFGQLIIFKESGIWALSGGIISATNWTDAHGDAPPMQYHETRNVSRETGCVNKRGGVSWVEADNLLYFAGQYGFYAFNGQAVKRVSGPIQPLFANRPAWSTDRVTAAIDQHNGLIFWCVTTLGGPGVGEGPGIGIGGVYPYPNLLLVYHYKDTVPFAEEGSVGAWTIYEGLSATSVATMLQRTQILQEQMPLIGQSDGHVSYLDAGQTQDEISKDNRQPVEWRWRGPHLFTVPERVSRWYYLTAEFEPQTVGAILSRFYLNRDNGDNHEASFEISEMEQPYAGVYKRRLGQYAKYLIPEFAGVDAPVRITGFQIEAEPVGDR